MKKVLFMIPSMGGGGAEKILVTLLNELCKQDLSITLVVLFGGGVYEKKVDKRVHMTVCHDIFAAKSVWARCIQSLIVHCLFWAPPSVLYRRYVGRRYDVEIAWLEGLATKAIAGGRTNARRYAWIHSDPQLLDYGSGAYSGFRQEKRCYQRYNRVICVSNAVKKSFEEKYGLPASVIYNCIDGERIVRMAGEPRIRTDRDELRLVSVGRMIPAKGYERLIRVMGRLKAEGYSFRLQIVGDGELRGQLEQQVLHSGLSDQVELTGFMENPYPPVRQADMFVCSSITEGYSMAACEAIILETPVIATDCLGIRDVIGDSGCGVIVENSEDALYEGLKGILDQPEILVGMRRQCRRRSTSFSLENGIRQVLNLIQNED